MVSLEYLAGFIDGEGSLSLNRIPRRTRSPEYCARLTIVNSNREILEEIHGEFGGMIADTGTRSPKWKVVYTLIWTNAAAESMLRRVSPRLRVKSRQAQALLEFAKHKASWKRPRDSKGQLLPMQDEELMVRKKFFWTLRYINGKGRGVDVPDAIREFASEFKGVDGGPITVEYLGGFIDGEGSLMINRVFSKRYFTYSYRPRIAITNTNRQVIEDILRDFGGIFINQRSRDPNWKDGYGVVWTNGMVAKLLDRVQPHLRVKAEQGKLLLNFDRHLKETPSRRGTGMWISRLPSELLDAREAFYQEIKRLNRRGPEPLLQPLSPEPFIDIFAPVDPIPPPP